MCTPFNTYIQLVTVFHRIPTTTSVLWCSNVLKLKSNVIFSVKSCLFWVQSSERVLDDCVQVTEEAGGIRLIPWRPSDSVQTLTSYLVGSACLVDVENTLLKSRSVYTLKNVTILLAKCANKVLVWLLLNVTIKLKLKLDYLWLEFGRSVPSLSYMAFVSLS